MNTAVGNDYLYRSDTVAVRRVACANRRRWVVTFDNHSIGPGFDRSGFGETFLRKEGISAIHILGCGNDWYQYPDVLAACEAARAAIDPDARRITYGSSMGGYAAIRFADALAADAVVALSPQYSNDLAVVPWEDRWQQDARRISWQAELSGTIRCGVPPLIVYDPTGPDRRHVELIEREAPGTRIAIPYGGHPVSTFLAEADLLRPILLRELSDRRDAARLQRQIRKARGSSSTYLSELAARQPRWRPQLAMALVRKALAHRPGRLDATLALARLLGQAGRYDDALPLHVDTVKRSNRNWMHLVAYAEALIASGDPVAAADIAREAVATEPDRAHLRHWLAWVLDRAGDVDAAIAEERIAIEQSPDMRLYRETLALYENRSLPFGAQISVVQKVARHAASKIRKSFAR